MDDSPEVIRQQMEETRASLSEKLETLEQQVVGTVQGARQSVADTVQSVKDAFDVKLQVQRHPWPMLAGSVAVGFATGAVMERMIPDARCSTEPADLHPHRWPTIGDVGISDRPAREELRQQPPPHAELHAKSDWLQSLAQEFGPELSKMKGLAVGAAMSVLREMLAQSMPAQLKPQVADVVDNITVKLGGEPIRGSLLQNGHAQSSTEGDINEERYATKMGRSLGPTQGPGQETLGRHNGR
jgi:hypothetical protein